MLRQQVAMTKLLVFCRRFYFPQQLVPLKKKKTIAIRQIKYLLKSDSLSLQEHEKFVEEKLCKNVYFKNLLMDVMVTMLFIFLKCKRPRLRYFGITKNR